jgi:hypothetical protein
MFKPSRSLKTNRIGFLFTLAHLATTFVAMILTAAAAHATSYFVAPVRVTDADPSLTQSLQSLVSSGVTSAGGDVAETEGQADYTLQSSLIKLGQAYVLSVTKMQKGHPVYTSKQKATNVEELDEATEKAVRAAMLSTQAKKDVRVGEVRPQDENKLKTRINSHDTTYFALGPAGFTNMGDSKISYDIAVGPTWEVTPRAQLRLIANLVASSSWKTYLGDLLIGVNYFVTDEDTSPYVGAGFGLGFTGSADSSASTVGGFAAMVGAGCQFFRTSSRQLDLFAGYTTVFANNTIGQPGAWGVRVGVMF